jgi:3-hydroxy-9,10-secoandrosta-1,3,5(10)-triene-9,17-dione monooxygenase
MARLQTSVWAPSAAAEELLERARALTPVLRDRATLTDEQRKLPAETVEDLKRAGIIRALAPERFGGQGLDPEVAADVAIEIARGCGSSGWLSSFYALHQFMAGWFSEAAQEEFWADGPDTLSSTVPGYRSLSEEAVPGGVRVSGGASFSSGVDYAQWAFVHTPTQTCLVPRSDFRIVDDWYTSGLRGTGSRGIVIEDAFVPEHRIVTNQDLANATFPGAGLSDSPWYRVRNPMIMILNHFILAPVIGMARGVQDIFDMRARQRIDPQVFQPAIERPGPQLRFAEASAELDVAESLLRGNLAEVRDSGVRDQVPTLEQRARIRRDITYAARLATQATNRLVDGMDSSALYDRNLLHRQARDVRAGGLQFVLHWEETAMQYSRVRWGLEPSTMLI